VRKRPADAAIMAWLKPRPIKAARRLLARLKSPQRAKTARRGPRFAGPFQFLTQRAARSRAGFEAPSQRRVWGSRQSYLCSSSPT
jgi:hypothetical protein